MFIEKNIFIHFSNEYVGTLRVVRKLDTYDIDIFYLSKENINVCKMPSKKIPFA